MARRKKRVIPTLPKLYKSCPFCKDKKEPDYKDFETLKKFLTDRAKIMGSKRTSVCSKHQRKLTVAIKRARHLGLLPYTPEL